MKTKGRRQSPISQGNRSFPHSPQEEPEFWTSGPKSCERFPVILCVLCLVAQLRPTLCNPVDCSPPGSSVHGDSPGKNTGVGCHALLQEIFLTKGWNPGLPHSRWILHRWSHILSHSFQPLPAPNSLLLCARFPAALSLFSIYVKVHSCRPNKIPIPQAKPYLSASSSSLAGPDTFIDPQSGQN